MSWYRLVSVGGLEGATTYLAMCGVVLGADRIHQHIVHWLLRYLRLCIPQESVDNNWTALSLWESVGDFPLRYPSGARRTRIGVGLQSSHQEQADRLSCFKNSRIDEINGRRARWGSTWFGYCRMGMPTPLYFWVHDIMIRRRLDTSLWDLQCFRKCWILLAPCSSYSGHMSSPPREDGPWTTAAAGMLRLYPNLGRKRWQVWLWSFASSFSGIVLTGRE
jgi:hypothetical protein